MTPLIECQQWTCFKGTAMTIVVALTKEDARCLAARRFGGDYGIRIRPSVAGDLAAWEERNRRMDELKKLLASWSPP